MCRAMGLDLKMNHSGAITDFICHDTSHKAKPDERLISQPDTGEQALEVAET
jgi:RecA/RadA recombinase